MAEGLGEVGGWLVGPIQDVPAVLSGGGDDGSEGGEVLGGGEGAEGAGDLHFDLHHAERLLSQVVGEGNGEVDEETQDVSLNLCNRMRRLWPGRPFGPSPV